MLVNFENSPKLSQLRDQRNFFSNLILSHWVPTGKTPNLKSWLALEKIIFEQQLEKFLQILVVEPSTPFFLQLDSTPLGGGEPLMVKPPI